jgi:hypothetical protein
MQSVPANCFTASHAMDSLWKIVHPLGLLPDAEGKRTRLIESVLCQLEPFKSWNETSELLTSYLAFASNDVCTVIALYLAGYASKAYVTTSARPSVLAYHAAVDTGDLSKFLIDLCFAIVDSGHPEERPIANDLLQSAQRNRIIDEATARGLLAQVNSALHDAMERTFTTGTVNHVSFEFTIVYTDPSFLHLSCRTFPLCSGCKYRQKPNLLACAWPGPKMTLGSWCHWLRWMNRSRGGSQD